MSAIDTGIRVLHVLFAGLWAGGTIVLVGAVLPAARSNGISADGLDHLVTRFSYLSMAAVGVLFVTGGHLAGQLYTVETLQATGNGHLVLTMTALWFALAGLSHVGVGRLRGGLRENDVQAGLEAGRSWLYASAAVAVALLVVAGLL